MACMCGDPYCWSCGPAQGNNRCEICGRWSEDGGCVDPKACDAKAKEADDQDRRRERAIADQMEEIAIFPWIDDPDCE